VDRFQITDGDQERNFFVGIFDGEANTVALESFAKGFGGDLGVMVAVNVETDKIVGVGVTTHSETPGVGSRTKTDKRFRAQFNGLPIDEPFKVKADGGEIDAVSGATISSRGVCAALMKSVDAYRRLKDRIMTKMKAFQA
jgi:electron transport complex protein RnfG